MKTHSLETPIKLKSLQTWLSQSSKVDKQMSTNSTFSTTQTTPQAPKVNLYTLSPTVSAPAIQRLLMCHARSSRNKRSARINAKACMPFCDPDLPNEEEGGEDSRWARLWIASGVFDTKEDNVLWVFESRDKELCVQFDAGRVRRLVRDLKEDGDIVEVVGVGEEEVKAFHEGVRKWYERQVGSGAFHLGPGP